jgi:tetratricopeptide (TPR) repeat protein
VDSLLFSTLALPPQNPQKEKFKSPPTEQDAYFCTMKTPIKKITVLFTLLISFGAAAQTLQDAIRLTNNEQFEKSRAAFKSLIAAQPTNGDNFFYFGELMLQMDNADSAKILFQKGVDINPTNPLTHIGMGRYYLVTGDNANAQKEIAYAKSLIGTQAGKKGMDMDAKRQAVMYNEMAKSYIYAFTPNYDEAITLTDMAAKLDPTNPEILLIRGDALYGKDHLDATPAIKSYLGAEKLNPQSCRAKVRIGRIYINGKNMPAAIGYFNAALKIDSTFAPAYRERGEAQYQIAHFDSAQRSMARYLQLNDSPLARYRYCLFLYKSGNFDEAIEQGKLSLAKDSSTIVIYRIIARSYAESKTPDPAKAVEAWNTFFVKQKAAGNPPLFADDFIYRAKAYSANKQDSLAIIDFNRALSMDTTKKDVYFQMATSYYIMKKFDLAAQYYRKKIDTNPSRATPGDWIAVGRSFQQMKNYVAADTAYKRAVALDPMDPSGWLYRAKANALLDPKSETDSAKVFYEHFYSLAIGDKEKNKRDLITAAKYLGGYYFIKKNFSCSKAWFNFVMELDPANTKVKEQLDTDKDLKAAATVDLSTCAPAPIIKEEQK